MDIEDKRYRRTVEYLSGNQTVIEANSPDKAGYFAVDIDLDKWHFIDSEYEIVNISKDYCFEIIK